MKILAFKQFQIYKLDNWFFRGSLTKNFQISKKRGINNFHQFELKLNLNSSKSINKQLVTYAASLARGADTKILDLNDYELPLFSEDKEKEIGQAELAKEF